MKDKLTQKEIQKITEIQKRVDDEAMRCLQLVTRIIEDSKATIMKISNPLKEVAPEKINNYNFLKLRRNGKDEHK